ncbi:MAG: helix-turn-helix domain-containing protein [Candidatus Lokiarchaeota archaeon]
MEEIETQDQKDLDSPDMSLDTLLEILGNPTRRIILSKLAKVPHSTSELHKTLGISRQAVHSQLSILKDYNLIEEINPDKRGGRYKIKTNLNVHIDISPDFFGIKYNMTEIEPEAEAMVKKDSKYSSQINKIKSPSDKMRFLGEKIREIEQNIATLEDERKELLQQKECLIIDLKEIMEEQYKTMFKKKKQAKFDNLEKEIFFTLFFNPLRYQRRINLDRLINELFFSDMDLIDRATHKTSIEHLLRDLSQFLDFLREENNKWFFDI